MSYRSVGVLAFVVYFLLLSISIVVSQDDTGAATSEDASRGPTTNPLKRGESRQSPKDLMDRSMSVEVEIPSSRSKRSKIKRRSTSKDENHDALFTEDAKPQTYFATFDATALSTAWVKLGGMAREYEDRVSAVERQKKAKLIGHVPESFSASATFPIEESASAPRTAIKSPWSSSPAPMSPSEEDQLKAEARKAIEGSRTLRRMDPVSSMEHVQRGLPLVMYLMCDCALDVQFARALPELESTIHKRRWTNRFTFVYIPVEAQKSFELTNTYRLDDQLVTVGDCLAGTCDGNKKTISVRFVPAFPATPRGFIVSLYKECCGDKFSLSLADLNAEGFKLDVMRTDGDGKGWGQILKVRWETPDRVSTAGGIPAIVVDNVSMGVHMEKYALRPTVPTWERGKDAVAAAAADIIRFLEDFQLGRLPLIVRSQPAIAPPNELRRNAAKGMVVDAVADNFRDIVTDQRRDVILLVYSPYCAGSVAIMPLFDQIAKLLASVPDNQVLVVKFDKTQNDFPVTGIKVTHFPSIFFFPAGDFDSPQYRFYDYSDFNGSKSRHNPMVPHNHFTKEMILKFVFEHGKNSASWPAALAAEVKGYKPELYSHDHEHSDPNH